MEFKNWSRLFDFIEEQDEDDEKYYELESIDNIPLMEASKLVDYKEGTIIWCNFKYNSIKPDNNNNYEKKRPVVILKDRIFGKVAVRLSSCDKKSETELKKISDNPYNHILPKIEEYGLDKKSYFKGNCVRLICHIDIERVLGELDEESLEKCKKCYANFIRDRYDLPVQFMEYLKFLNIDYHDYTGDFSKVRQFKQIEKTKIATIADITEAFRKLCDKFSINNRLAMIMQPGKDIPFITYFQKNVYYAFLFIPGNPPTGDIFWKYDGDYLKAADFAAKNYFRNISKVKYALRIANDEQYDFWVKSVDNGMNVDSILSTIRINFVGNSKNSFIEEFFNPAMESSSSAYDKFMEQVDDFRLTKKKFRMPKLNGNGLVGNVIILNTVNDSSIRRFITNPLIDDRGIYKCVYRNRNINMTVKGKTLHVRETKERTEYYAKCRSSFGLNGYISFSGYAGKNVYYDIYRENELFFSNIPESTSKNIRAEEYFRMLKENVFCVDMTEYTNKLMFIDLKEWEAKVQSSSNKDYDNPINLIYYGLKKNLELVKETLKDVNVVIFTQDAFIKFNPSDCDENSYKHFLKEVKRLSNTIVKEEEIEDKTIDKVDDTLNNGKDSDSENVTNDKSVSDVISVAAKDISVNEPDKSSDEKVRAALQNPEVISKLAEKIYEPVNIKNTAISRRDRELREQQKKLKVDGANLEDLISVKASQIKVPVNDVSNVINTENHEITQVQFDNFAKVYNDKLYMKDLVSIAYDLQDKSIPVYIRKVEKEDTSDALNAKYTLTFHLEDSNRGRHTLKFDVPKFIDGRYMYLNGHKKIFNNQRFLKPL